MHGISIEAITFLGVVWAVAFASSIARTCTDTNLGSLRSIFAFGCTSGFVAIGIIGAVCGDPSAVGFNAIGYVAAAALIGGSGKEQDKYAKAAMRGFLRGFKMTIDETQQDEKKE